MKSLSLLIIALFLVSCTFGSMSPKAKVKTASMIVSTTIEIAYANALAICETIEEKPVECAELEGLKVDVDAISECVTVTVEKVMDIKEKLDKIE